MYDIYDKAGNYIMVQTSDTTEMREDIYYRIKCAVERELESENIGYWEIANRAKMRGQSFREFAWLLFTCTKAHYAWVTDRGRFTGTNLTREHDIEPALSKILGGGW